MDTLTHITVNRIDSARPSELSLNELDAVAGGSGNSGYNIFYQMGYWIGEATAWVGDAVSYVNNAYMQGVANSNGAILAYM